MEILEVLICFLLPPLAVFMKEGAGTQLLLNILLCCFGWIPAIIHAVYIYQKS